MAGKADLDELTRNGRVINNENGDEPVSVLAHNGAASGFRFGVGQVGGERTKDARHRLSIRCCIIFFQRNQSKASFKHASYSAVSKRSCTIAGQLAEHSWNGRLRSCFGFWRESIANGEKAFLYRLELRIQLIKGHFSPFLNERLYRLEFSSAIARVHGSTTRDLVPETGQTWTFKMGGVRKRTGTIGYLRRLPAGQIPPRGSQRNARSIPFTKVCGPGAGSPAP